METIKHFYGPELKILDFKWSLCGMIYDTKDSINIIVRKKIDITCDRCKEKVGVAKSACQDELTDNIAPFSELSY